MLSGLASIFGCALWAVLTTADGEFGSEPRDKFDLRVGTGGLIGTFRDGRYFRGEAVVGSKIEEEATAGFTGGQFGNLRFNGESSPVGAVSDLASGTRDEIESSANLDTFEGVVSSNLGTFGGVANGNLGTFGGVASTNFDNFGRVARGNLGSGAGVRDGFTNGVSDVGFAGVNLHGTKLNGAQITGRLGRHSIQQGTGLRAGLGRVVIEDGLTDDGFSGSNFIAGSFGDRKFGNNVGGVNNEGILNVENFGDNLQNQDGFDGRLRFTSLADRTVGAGLSGLSGNFNSGQLGGRGFGASSFGDLGRHGSRLNIVKGNAIRLNGFNSQRGDFEANRGTGKLGGQSVGEEDDSDEDRHAGVAAENIGEFVSNSFNREIQGNIPEIINTRFTGRETGVGRGNLNIFGGGIGGGVFGKTADGFGEDEFKSFGSNIQSGFGGNTFGEFGRGFASGDISSSKGFGLDFSNSRVNNFGGGFADLSLGSSGNIGGRLQEERLSVFTGNFDQEPLLSSTGGKNTGAITDNTREGRIGGFGRSVTSDVGATSGNVFVNHRPGHPFGRSKQKKDK